jgi:hypothetical protein
MVALLTRSDQIAIIILIWIMLGLSVVAFLIIPKRFEQYATERLRITELSAVLVVGVVMTVGVLKSYGVSYYIIGLAITGVAYMGGKRLMRRESARSSDKRNEL